jgi:hypothetical protein
MLEDQVITQRLEDMARQGDPSTQLWPENCAGSRKALVIFVGPSPGGKKEDKPRDIELNHTKPLWNVSYDKPLKWSSGFKTSFKPIVETIFKRPYEEAGKLIARVNMDWMQNPESKDVSYLNMWKGCSYTLPVIYECNPELVIPMDIKSFEVLQIALYVNGYEIIPRRFGKIEVEISDRKRKSRHHHRIMAFDAKKEERSFLVIKSLQHPARIYNKEYAQRVGQAIRDAAMQI